MDYEIRRDPRRNRVYFRAPEGLHIPGARYDMGSRLHWFGVADIPRGGIASKLDALVAEAEQLASAKAQYDALLGTIPSDYQRRHGALYGGNVTMDGETMTETPPVLGLLRAAKWEQFAHVILAVGHTGSCAGRVMDEDTLYRASLTDGRLVFREIHCRGFGDDLRETYYLAPDLYAVVMEWEIRASGITPDMAREWLAQYRGCVGTELYEFAATSAVRPEACNALQTPRKLSLSGGTEGR